MPDVKVPIYIQNAEDFAHRLAPGDEGFALVAKADLTGFELADVSDAATLGGNLPAYFLPAASFDPAAFEAAGAVTAGIAAHAALADPHTQYALESALGTMATQAEANYLLATGARTGATSSAQAFTTGLTVGSTGAKLQSDGTLKGYTAATPLIQYGDGVDANSNPRLTPKTPIGVGVDLWVEGMNRLIINPGSATRFNNGAWEFAAGCAINSTGFSAWAETLQLQTKYANTVIFRGGGFEDTTISGYDQTRPINLQIAGSSATNAIVDVARLRHNTSGASAANFGIGLRAQIESSGNNINQDVGRLTWEWDRDNVASATNATKSGRARLSAFYNTTERILFDGIATSSESKIGVHGATPIAKPTITGSRGANAALADLLTQLASYGWITDGTTV